MAHHRGEDDEGQVLVNEARRKPLTDEAHPNSVRRFIAFVVGLMILLAFIISISPGQQKTENNSDEDTNDNMITTASPTLLTRPPGWRMGHMGGGGASHKTMTPTTKAAELDADTAEEELSDETIAVEEAEEINIDNLPDDETSKEMKDEKEEEDENPSKPSPISTEMSSNEAEQLKTLLNSSVEEDADILVLTAETAPRTSHVQYNELLPKRKYMLYNPSGGMSNQEIELVNAMRMASALERTLYVPMVGRHSTLPLRYNNLKPSELFPADRVYDFGLMSQYIQVVPLNVTLRVMLSKFTSTFGAHNIRYVATEFNFPGPEEAKILKPATQPLIFFDGKAMWSRWWPSLQRPHLRNVAIKVAQVALGSQFYAIHGRLGDEAYKWGGKDSSEAFVKTTVFRSWDKHRKCYLASDDPSNKFFDALKQKIKVVTWWDLKGPEVDEFRALFPSENVQKDMFGVLDKLICTLAEDFIGTSFSTFSLEIKMMRGNSKYVFPERYALKHNSTR